MWLQAVPAEIQIEGVLHQLLLLVGVHGREASRRRCRGATPRVRDVRRDLPPLVTHDGLNAGGDVMEGAHVEGLLLGPHQLGVRVPPQLPHHQVEGEWRQLLEAHDGNLLLETLLSAGLSQIVVHLAAAHDEALHSLLHWRVGAPVTGGFVHDEALEAHAHDALVVGHLVELRQRGLAVRVSQQVLGRHDDERLPELPVDLTAQDVEVVCGGGAVDHGPIGGLHLPAQVASAHPLGLVDGGHCVRVLIHPLQEAFYPPAAVLGALPVIAMRQQAHKPALPHPLRLTAA
mmetsp:Transcript_20449/g.61578  ORF Transcript_20449/g.61578 Transcript_20449/m.61578 type:complete len:288 (+) Transcript_20449:529-1392(+)